MAGAATLAAAADFAPTVVPGLAPVVVLAVVAAFAPVADVAGLAAVADLAAAAGAADLAVTAGFVAVVGVAGVAVVCALAATVLAANSRIRDVIFIAVSGSSFLLLGSVSGEKGFSLAEYTNPAFTTTEN
jgi:lysylphosphatidylglycerol synthetase-like protein (DUF2156 family)